MLITFLDHMVILLHLNQRKNENSDYCLENCPIGYFNNNQTIGKRFLKLKVVN